MVSIRANKFHFNKGIKEVNEMISDSKGQLKGLTIGVKVDMRDGLSERMM